MAKAATHVDKPEPRWQAVLALLVIGGINLALPSSLRIAPRWVLPLLIVVLLAPSIVAHRVGRYSLNHAIGVATNAIITFALIGSVIRLVVTLPSHREAPIALLLSGGELWMCNVLAFALWYWRLDGGGPNRRDEHHEFGSHSFVFPQMQIEKVERGRFGVERWRPGFVDYLFIAFTNSSTFGPTDSPLLARWAKIFSMVQIFISLTIVVLLISRAVGVL